MKFLKLGLVLSTLTLFFIACAQNQNTAINSTGNAVVASAPDSNLQSTPVADELASARKIYAEQCINCHKADGTGGIVEFDGKRIKAPNFTSDKLKKEPDAEFIEIIENGEPSDGMPAYKGQISDADIKNLVKYIRREFQSKQ